MPDPFNYLVSQLSGEKAAVPKEVKNRSRNRKIEGVINKRTEDIGKSHFSYILNTSSKKFRNFIDWWRAKFDLVERAFYENWREFEKFCFKRGWIKYSKIWWDDIDHIAHIATDFESPLTWRKGHLASYLACARRGYLREVSLRVWGKARHPEWNWERTVESIKNSEFGCLKSWRKQFPTAYEFCRKNGRLNQLFTLIEEKCHQKIRRYKNHKTMQILNASSITLPLSA